MAMTNYNPDGSPQALALGNFGTTQSTLDPSQRMPTMSQFMSGGATAYTGAPMPSAPPPMGGGGGFQRSTPNTIGNQVSYMPTSFHVPEGQVGQMYTSALTDPSVLEANKGYQYLKQQAEQALARSAGARRQRFSGGTMLDFMRQGAGMAAANFNTMMPQYLQGAQYERQNLQNEAQYRSQEAWRQDPFGKAQAAYSRSPGGPMGLYDKYHDQSYWNDLWNKGKQLSSMG